MNEETEPELEADFPERPEADFTQYPLPMKGGRYDTKEKKETAGTSPTPPTTSLNRRQ